MNQRSKILAWVLSMSLLASSTATVMAQDPDPDTMAPATFGWGLGDPPGENVEPTVTTTDDGQLSTGGGIVDWVMQAGDPRASGMFSQGGNQREFTSIRSSVGRFWTRIVNDDGSWFGMGTGVNRKKQKPPKRGTPFAHYVQLAVLEGAGAYEGLTLVLTSTVDDNRGYIFPTDSIPLPEPPAK